MILIGIAVFFIISVALIAPRWGADSREGMRSEEQILARSSNRGPERDEYERQLALELEASLARARNKLGLRGMEARQ